ncbi:MAG: CRISPR-associated protein Cas4 [Ktedonobacterales bacterium]
MMDMMPTTLLEVTDVKQYVYCPRIPFYRYCLPAIRPVTYGMGAGIRSHEQQQAREERRSLRAYGLSSGERIFESLLRSERLGLVGKLDMAVRLEREVVVVDYKLSPGAAGMHFKAQLAAYALLVEEAWGLPVQRAFLYHLPDRKAEEVMMTLALRRRVGQAVEAMHAMVVSERMPPPPTNRARCVPCEFRRFCNDAV